MLPINDYRDGAEVAATVAAAVKTGLFEALGDGPLTAAGIAKRAGLDARATRIVLEALADLGLVAQSGDRYAPTDEGRRRFADRDSPDYVGKGLPLWLTNLRRWTRLPEALAQGGLPDQQEAQRSEDQLADFLAGMAAGPPERTRRMVRGCLDRHPEARSVLDLGGGPGHIARAFVDAGLEATMVERPEVVDYGRRALGLGEVEGLTLVAGDFLTDPLPAGPFDIVLMSNITHIYGPDENRRLLARVAEVVRPGGLVAIADFVRGRSPRAARFAVVMLLATEAGDTYDADTYRAWLDDAGCGDMVIEDVDVDRQMITARRLKP